MRRHELLGRGHEGRDGCLHVGRTPAVEPSVTDRRLEGSVCHASRGPGGTTSVCPAKHEQRGLGAPPQPEVGDAVGDERLGDEAGARQPGRDERLASAVVGRDRTPRNQLRRRAQARETGQIPWPRWYQTQRTGPRRCPAGAATLGAGASARRHSAGVRQCRSSMPASIDSAAKSAVGRRGRSPFAVDSIESMRESGLLWLMSQARLVGESEETIASS